MRRLIHLFALFIVVFFPLSPARAQQEIERPIGGVVNFLEPILPDPVLQHSKETYVVSGCAYCHGVDLKVRNGEAADLLHSRVVALDENGSVLGPLLHKGIPQTAKLSPMPQYSDLSDREIADLVRWIHYSRQQERYKELIDATGPAGDTAAGRAYFDKTCSSCHTPGDMAKAVRSYDSGSLREHVLRPPFLSSVRSFRVEELHDTKMVAARQRHGQLLETYSAAEVANVLAYLNIMK